MLADDIANTPIPTATPRRCTCCRAIAALTDDKRAELERIIRGEVLHPQRRRPFLDREVGAWLGVNEWTVRDCRNRHYGVRRYAT